MLTIFLALKDEAKTLYRKIKQAFTLIYNYLFLSGRLGSILEKYSHALKVKVG